jgi:hypothetical protein
MRATLPISPFLKSQRFNEFAPGSNPRKRREDNQWRQTSCAIAIDFSDAAKERRASSAELGSITFKVSE